MKSICIITARKGSKRVPGKNIRPFLGRPIISYPITAALESGIFDEVMVSTDGEEIAEIARQYGANVPFMRSEATSNDFATTADVIHEVIDEYAKRGQVFDIVCCIYPCAVFATKERLLEASELMQDEETASVKTIVEFSSPPVRGYKLVDGDPVLIHPELSRARTQDMEKLYHDGGQFYFWRGKSFNKGDYEGIKGRRNRALILPDETVQDVDNESDLKIAELKYRAFILNEKF